MPLIIRNVTQDDLQSLIKIEALCFPPSEAADDKTLSERLMAYPESFFIAIYNNEPVGFIDGAVTNSKTISDDMFEDVKCHNPKGMYQSIFGLSVIPEARRIGVAAKLMNRMIENAKENGRRGLILTCKEHLIHYYEKFGYKNLGVSKSVHGGAVWYDMLLEF